MNIEGSRWLITGGGRGLGRAVAIEAAGLGARVVVAARTSAELDEVVRTIHERGGEAYGLALDLGDKERVHAIAGEAAGLVGPIDVLVHAAATLGPSTLEPVLETTCEDLERALVVNVIGPHRLTRAVVPSMLLRDRGVVVHVSSDAATEAYPTWGAYGASKAAFELLGRTLAAELASSSLRSFVVDPGEMDTRLHAAALPSADRALLPDPSTRAKQLVALALDASLGRNGARVVLTTLGAS